MTLSSRLCDSLSEIDCSPLWISCTGASEDTFVPKGGQGVDERNKNIHFYFLQVFQGNHSYWISVNDEWKTAEHWSHSWLQNRWRLCCLQGGGFFFCFFNPTSSVFSVEISVSESTLKQLLFLDIQPHFWWWPSPVLPMAAPDAGRTPCWEQPWLSSKGSPYIHQGCRDKMGNWILGPDCSFSEER